MASIKEVLQAFCYRVNLPAPSSFVGVASPAEQQFLSLFQFIGDNLRNRPFQWPQLKRGYTFLTSTGVSRYELPGDFYRILDSSQWDTTNHWPLRGPISDFNYNVRNFAVVSLQTRKAFHIVGPTQYLYSTAPYSQRSAGTFEITPAGANNTDSLFLGYLSGNWVWPADWVTGTVYAAGALVTGNQNIYRTAAGGTSGATRPSGTTSVSDGTVIWVPYNEPFACSAANALLTDTALCLFDDDVMVEGMRWAYLRSKGQDYQQERQDWEQQVKSAFARFNGPTRINMADEAGDYDEWPLTPAGSWNV